MSEQPTAKFAHYGLSPWEFEVLYDTLKRYFEVDEVRLELDDPKYVSMIELGFPLPYDDNFFQAFSMESWFKLKAVIKDIKRRRGRRGLKVFIRFAGRPAVAFPLAHKDDRRFEMGIEKLEYLVDIVPVQLESIPKDTEEVLYAFSDSSYKWSPSIAIDKNGRNWFFRNGVWK